MKRVMELIQEGHYALNTLHGAMEEPWEGTLKEQWDRVYYGLGVGTTNSYMSCLLMVGSALTGTPLHFDWTRAVNYAVSLSGLDGDAGRAHPEVGKMEEDGMPPETLAWWLFFDGELLLDPRFERWLSRSTKRTNFMRLPRAAKDPLDAKSLLTWEQAQDLMQQPWATGKVFQLYQRHNGLIQAPVGWVHQVVNIRPCVKFAFDCLVPKELPDYAIVHARLVSPLATMPQDYRAWPVAAEEAIAGISELFGMQHVKAGLRDRQKLMRKRKS